MNLTPGQQDRRRRRIYCDMTPPRPQTSFTYRTRVDNYKTFFCLEIRTIEFFSSTTNLFSVCENADVYLPSLLLVAVPIRNFPMKMSFDLQRDTSDNYSADGVNFQSMEPFR